MADQAVATALRERVHQSPVAAAGSPPAEVWRSTEEVESIEFLRHTVHDGGLTAAGKIDWESADGRRQAVKRSWALEDGSFPIPNREYWYKARQSIGRARGDKRKKVIDLLVRRGKTLRIPKKDLDALKALPVTAAACTPEQLRAKVHGVEAMGATPDLATQLRERVHGLSAAALVAATAMLRWSPDLHPRGADGKFIDANGWVRGIFSFLDDAGVDRRQGNYPVSGFYNSDKGETWVKVVAPHDKAEGFARAREVRNGAPPRASIPDTPTGIVPVPEGWAGPEGERMHIDFVPSGNVNGNVETLYSGDVEATNVPSQPGDVLSEHGRFRVVDSASSISPPFRVEMNEAEPGEPEYWAHQRFFQSREDAEGYAEDMDVTNQLAEERGLTRNVSSEPPSSPPANFLADLQRFDEALAPYRVEFEDGTSGISPDAPSDLADAYRRLLQMGYANGWL